MQSESEREKSVEESRTARAKVEKFVRKFCRKRSIVQTNKSARAPGEGRSKGGESMLEEEKITRPK